MENQANSDELLLLIARFNRLQDGHSAGEISEDSYGKSLAEIQRKLDLYNSKHTTKE